MHFLFLKENKMKKALILIIALIMILGTVGCSSNTNENVFAYEITAENFSTFFDCDYDFVHEDTYAGTAQGVLTFTCKKKFDFESKSDIYIYIDYEIKRESFAPYQWEPQKSTVALVIPKNEDSSEATANISVTYYENLYDPFVLHTISKVSGIALTEKELLVSNKQTNSNGDINVEQYIEDFCYKNNMQFISCDIDASFTNYSNNDIVTENMEKGYSGSIIFEDESGVNQEQYFMLVYDNDGNEKFYTFKKMSNDTQSEETEQNASSLASEPVIISSCENPSVNFSATYEYGSSDDYFTITEITSSGTKVFYLDESMLPVYSELTEEDYYEKTTYTINYDDNGEISGIHTETDTPFYENVEHVYIVEDNMITQGDDVSYEYVFDASQKLITEKVLNNNSHYYYTYSPIQNGEVIIDVRNLPLFGLYF